MKQASSLLGAHQLDMRAYIISIDKRSAQNYETIDYIRPMDMKLVSATSHRLALRPRIISTVHSKNHP